MNLRALLCVVCCSIGAICIARGASAQATTAAPMAAPVVQAATESAEQAPAVTPTPASITTPLEGVVITARRTQDSAQAGEAVRYELVIAPSASDESRGAISGLSIDSAETLGVFDVLSITQPTRNSDGRFMGELVLMTLETGTQLPTPITLRYREAGLELSGEIALPTLDISSVLGNEPDPAKYRDIAGLFEIRELRDLLPFIIAGAVILLLALAALILWLRRRNRPVPIIAPHEWAFAELARLNDQALPSRGAFGPYYDSLTHIIRHYVALRYDIPAQKQTSREFMESARTHPDFPATETSRLRELLRLADLVKFAHATPASSDCDAHFAQAQEFVASTRAQEAPVSEEKRS